MEWASYVMLAIFLGMRHGMDSDHVAAIADMVGSESRRRQQLALGIMYAIGHGAIVFVMGVAALMVGARLPESSAAAIELLVGVTLVLLGGMMLFSLFRRGEVKSRFQLLYEFGHTVTRWLRGRREMDSCRSFSHVGWAGALIIGIIHGIGVESPTQLAIITHAVGKVRVSALSFSLCCLSPACSLRRLLQRLDYRGDFGKQSSGNDCFMSLVRSQGFTAYG
ncbi:High-affinity nickel-transporter [Geobacillus thermoleovorans]|uniref:HoxN/HupN/NixA family nickel/cobalt transporter n=1 Tax=Geobacillus thermoleovorans TaxID=33941 RepID=UPI00272E43F6|nr:High-affinity nickel-transporter [Geobacillus thermoleovorans]